MKHISTTKATNLQPTTTIRFMKKVTGQVKLKKVAFSAKIVFLK